jgi:hypothetical protein
MRLLARGAHAPVDHFGFIDDEAVVFGRLETGGFPNRAIDIDGCVALAADEVVVVVTDPGLVKSGSTGGFDPAQDASCDERVEIVVHRLSGKRAEPAPCRHHNELGIAVLALVPDDVEDGKPRRGLAEVRPTEQLLNFGGHTKIMPLYLDAVQISARIRKLERGWAYLVLRLASTAGAGGGAGLALRSAGDCE